MCLFLLIYWINASSQGEREVQKLKEQIIWFSKVDLGNLWDLFSWLGLGSRGTWLKSIFQVGLIYLLGVLLIVVLLIVVLIKCQMGQIEQFWSQPLLVRLIRVVDVVAYPQENWPGAKTVIEKRGGYCWETMGLSMGLSCFCMSCEGGTNCSFLLLYYHFKTAYIGKQREDLLTVQNFKDNVSHWEKGLLKKFIKKDLGSQNLEFLSCDTNSLHVQHLPGLVARATLP